MGCRGAQRIPTTGTKRRKMQEAHPGRRTRRGSDKMITGRGLTQVSSASNSNFTWGFRPNFDVTVLVPVVTNHFDATNIAPIRGTGLGDAFVLVKYRFYRRD